MFNNIGNKVKIMAQVLCIIEIVACIITGIFYILHWRALFSGILIAVLGSFLSWLTNLALYAIGHIAENTDIIVRKLNNKNTLKNESANSPTTDNLKTIQHKKPIEKAQLDGSWWCSCGALNRNSDISCSVCFKKR